MAQAYFYINLVSFYNLESKSMKKIFFAGDATDNKKAELDFTNIYYTATASSAEYFFALKKMPNQQSDLEMKKLVHIFSWEGEPLFELQVKEDIHFFDIDMRKKQLFAVTQINDEYRILRYSLPL